MRKEKSVEYSWLDLLIIQLAEIAGTKSMVIICFVIPLIPIYFPTSMSTVQFISSGFLQLVYLPILAFAAVVADRKNEARYQAQLLKSDKDHKALSEALKLLQKELEILKSLQGQSEGSKDKTTE